MSTSLHKGWRAGVRAICISNCSSFSFVCRYPRAFPVRRCYRRPQTPRPCDSYLFVTGVETRLSETACAARPCWRRSAACRTADRISSSVIYRPRFHNFSFSSAPPFVLEPVTGRAKQRILLPGKKELTSSSARPRAAYGHPTFPHLSLPPANKKLTNE